MYFTRVGLTQQTNYTYISCPSQFSVIQTCILYLRKYFSVVGRLPTCWQFEFSYVSACSLVYFPFNVYMHICILHVFVFNFVILRIFQLNKFLYFIFTSYHLLDYEKRILRGIFGFVSYTKAYLTFFWMYYRDINSYLNSWGESYDKH